MQCSAVQDARPTDKTALRCFRSFALSNNSGGVKIFKAALQITSNSCLQAAVERGKLLISQVCTS